MIVLQVLFALVLSSIVMTLVWWRQLYTKNAGIVDGWWAYLFGMITIMYVIITPGITTREMILVIMVGTWSIRLGTHLLIRNTSHTDEDIRYKKLRDEYGHRQKYLMWRFFMYQAFSNVLLSAPFLIISLDTSSHVSILSWISVGVWFVAIIGESVADHQLRTFKKNPMNKSKVCRVGLWNYSRHPNYFFEWLIWVSFAMLAIASPFGWIAMYCPLLIFLLLNKVTGIPMLEELAIKSKGSAYIEYQQTTSAFFPWFTKAN